MGTKLSARVTMVFSFVVAAIFFPIRASSQERLKVIYSQFTMTNSATWFAREAGLFERHGLMADLVYVDSTPAVQALTAGAAPVVAPRFAGSKTCAAKSSALAASAPPPIGGCA